MATDNESLIDGLTNLTWAIRKDGKLRQWFHALTKKSVWDRRNAIFVMCERIAADGNHAELVGSLKMLIVPKVFEAARMLVEGTG